MKIPGGLLESCLDVSMDDFFEMSMLGQKLSEATITRTRLPDALPAINGPYHDFEVYVGVTPRLIASRMQHSLHRGVNVARKSRYFLCACKIFYFQSLHHAQKSEIRRRALKVHLSMRSCPKVWGAGVRRLAFCIKSCVSSSRYLSRLYRISIPVRS